MKDPEVCHLCRFAKVEPPKTEDGSHRIFCSVDDTTLEEFCERECHCGAFKSLLMTVTMNDGTIVNEVDNASN